VSLKVTFGLACIGRGGDDAPGSGGGLEGRQLRLGRGQTLTQTLGQRNR
jgi:hypothetical protein